MAACLASAACVTTQDRINTREEFLSEATRTYSDVSQEQVIRAAEAVLHQSDPADFQFSYSPNGFVGTRSYFVYAVIAAQRGQEKWDFATVNTANGVQASLTVVDNASYNAYGATNEYNMNRKALQRLFWSRVDYVLGKRPDWITCEQAIAEVQAAGTNTEVLSGLCGFTSDGKNAPPPSRIAGKPGSTQPLPS